MKKILMVLIMLVVSFGIVGCTETNSKNEDGKQTREFKIGESATINDKITIKINEIKKIEKECFWEYDGDCQSYTEPDNDYFVIIDLTIENKGNEDLVISSILSFELKDGTGEKGQYAMLTNSINSQLDGSVMPNDLLKGQIAYDVKDNENYSFYFKDSLLDSPIKFVFNKSDIK
ncbi:MAG: DUF4352 domain-containing protein [Bacilli bacterium]|nr:DUF4352 domain-containing protein [Bacilli bacterium]MDD4282832.1 DUF4352 domain-containing protein [Bacilli bacterium]MDD4719114.1 DUF4352 domain-containing protein [Bacilli bacterium]